MTTAQEHWERRQQLWAELEAMQRAGIPDPQAFARLGADIIETLRDRPRFERGELVETVLLIAGGDAAAASAFKHELDARGL